MSPGELTVSLRARILEAIAAAGIQYEDLQAEVAELTACDEADYKGLSTAEAIAQAGLEEEEE